MKKILRIFFLFYSVVSNFLPILVHVLRFNPVALRKAKIVYNFGLSECNKIK